ncbi:hypothetical protein J9978_06420 [Chromobacterium violaceum]|uniref:carbamoyltransferase C-terminal domain-containing protein n=1 Tax=Chromobacterium violaceum TaxID=536 RepID=UPI001B33753C|nr:carbamoyltransferase C-terminal domain-containing protein [Chromobacterium violaceum]MBP4049133.1 hypothetical protein [Chromobacterium violaceum]
MNVHCGINLGHDAGVAFYDGSHLELWEFERMLGLKHACGGTTGAEATLSAVLEPQRENIAVMAFSDYFTPRAQGLPQIVLDHCRASQQSRDNLHLLGEACVLGASHQVGVVGHHYAHAASAFLTSPHESALILCLDGIGSDDCCGYLYAGEGQRILAQLPFKAFYGPRFGLLYECASRAIFGSQFDTGKLMGLAAFGSIRPEWVETLRLMIAGNAFRRRFSALLDPVDAAIAAPQLTLNGIAYQYSEQYGDYFSEAIVSGKLDIAGAYAQHFPEEFGALTVGDASAPVARDLAATVQHVFESELIRLVQGLRRAYPQRVICYAGGCALNINANSRILAEGGFDDIAIPSCCNDSGIALGAALVSFHAHDQSNRDSFDRPSPTFSGPAFPGFIHGRPAVDLPGTVAQKFSSKQALIEEVAKRLHQGQVLGWVAGRMETGPRALGRRSMLASPLIPGMRSRVSERIKGREWFRPIAPIAKRSDAAAWFDGPIHKCAEMLFAVRSNRLLEVTHADGTARLQTVADSDDISGLLQRFGEISGVPVLMNTSLNGPGKPIVNDMASVAALLTTTQLHGVAWVDEALLLTKTDLR